MKQSVAVFLVMAIVAGVGFAGFWFGRSGAPTSQARNEIAVGPTADQNTSTVSGPTNVPTIPEQQKAPPKRLQSTYVPQGDSRAQQEAAATTAPATKDHDQPPKNGRPAAELFAEIETDDVKKSAFPDPIITAHQAMLNETPDPDWSQTAAQQLRDYLAAQLGNRFEYPLVQCGQDLCEIQAASFFGGDSDADERDFQTAENGMPLQPWWTTLQFDQFSTRFSSSKNGRILAIVMVTRK
jgi:hypothetical protein